MADRKYSSGARPGQRAASKDKVAPKKTGNSNARSATKKASMRATSSKKKEVRISKGESISREKAAKVRKKPGGSNVGKYKNVPSDEFAGPAGGAPKGSYPINTMKRAKSALRLAHNAPNPGGIKRKVYSEYPSLRKSAKKK